MLAPLGVLVFKMSTLLFTLFEWNLEDTHWVSWENILKQQSYGSLCTARPTAWGFIFHLESIIFKYYYLQDDIVTALIVLVGMLVLSSYYY